MSGQPVHGMQIVYEAVYAYEVAQINIKHYRSAVFDQAYWGARSCSMRQFISQQVITRSMIAVSGFALL